MLPKPDLPLAFDELFRQGTQLVYKKGEFVIRPSEAPSGIFYIEQGLVKAYGITKYGEDNLLVVRKEHEIFPLIWAITGQERSIIYQTLSPTVLRHVSRQKFLDYIQTHPSTMQAVLDMVVEMYRIHSERILSLEYRSVRERLISFLLMMSERFGKETAQGLVINVPLRHQDIASSINASRETTSREIASLERKELISNHRSLIILKDIAKLRSYL